MLRAVRDNLRTWNYMYEAKMAVLNPNKDGTSVEQLRETE